ncbi:MAG: DUF2142 domain-containing protein [Clostridiales bacterium]|nr:DUF2142 domain-containing protein [Clostridiales bacterium]
MKKILNQICRYFLPLMTAGMVLLLVAGWLFPNRVLDTYEMNISGPEEQETLIPLSCGSVISYTMNTGSRPLRGIQPGVSLQGGKYGKAVLRCQVYREPSHELVSDNMYPLSELTAGMQANLDNGAQPDLSMQAMYTYIPFADYEKCKGDIALVFSYESNGDVPEPFAGVEISENAQNDVIVPAILVNETPKENTDTYLGEKKLKEGLCGYTVYTHNTYPLIYDLRLMICIFLAASVSAQAVCVIHKPEAVGEGFRSLKKRLKQKAQNAVHSVKVNRRKYLTGAGIVLAVAVFAVLLESLLWNGHALRGTQYRSDLLKEEGVQTRLQAESGRQKLTEEEENAVLRNRENARILAELNGTEYIPPVEENIIEEEDGIYRKVKRTRLEIQLPEERYIHTLTLTVPETEEGNTVTVWADGKKEVSEAWLDERICKGSYVLNRQCRTLKMEIIGSEPLIEERNAESEMEMAASGEFPVDLEVIADNEFSWNPVRMVFLFSVFLLTAFFIKGRTIFAERPETVFAFLSLVLGSILIYAVGLNQIGYDEHIHLKTAYERSFGSTVLTTESAMQMEASTMPSFGNLEERRLVETYAELNNDFSWANITHQSRFPNYDVRSYLQISIFLWLGRILKLPFVWCMMLGKFGNLLLYTIVCYFAVKSAKQGKMLIAALALIPNCVFAAACFSYDAVVNSFLLLAMVLTLNQMFERKQISWVQTLVLLGAFLAGSTAKPIYIFMAFPLLLFPKEKFGGRWKGVVYKLCVCALMLLLIYTFFFPPVSASSNFEVMGNLAYAGDKRSQGTSVLGQISWIFQNPLVYTRLLLGSMLGELWNYVSGAKRFIAYGYLGGMSVLWTWLGLSVLFFAAVFSPKEEERAAVSARYKIGNILVILGMSAVIWTSMYVTFTAVGADVINGVQGRYFLPLFLSFFSCFYQGKWKLRFRQEHYAKLIFAVLVIMNLYGTWSLAVMSCNG